MTKEERIERKRARDLHDAAMEAEFPEARLNLSPPLDLNWSQICLESGDPNSIRLRRSINAKWHEEESSRWHGEDKSTVECISVDLRKDVKSLAALIRALVVRYNAIAKDINSEALAIPRMEPLAMIDSEDPPGRPQ